MHVLLVGLGNMGNKYFWKLEQMGERLVLCDIDPSKEKKPYPFYCHFGDVKEDVRAVIVAVDPKYHVSIAKEFLSKDIPVLLEKPPALSSKEFESIKNHEKLYISEVESYSVCAQFLRKPERFIKIERFGKGKGYISPLWTFPKSFHPLPRAIGRTQTWWKGLSFLWQERSLPTPTQS